MYMRVFALCTRPIRWHARVLYIVQDLCVIWKCVLLTLIMGWYIKVVYGLLKHLKACVMSLKVWKWGGASMLQIHLNVCRLMQFNP